MCTQAQSGPVSLFRFWIGGPNASLPRHIPGTDQALTLTPPDSESPLAAESVPIDASGLYKIAHSVDGNAVLEKEIRPLRNSNPAHKKWNLFILVPIVCLYGPKPSHDEDHFRRGDSRGGADACHVACRCHSGRGPKPKDGPRVDVQIGRDRDDRDRRRRNDSDVTVGVGPGGVTIGPRQNCRMVTTTVERDDGRTITRKERRCD